jgi:hypothetical protein
MYLFNPCIQKVNPFLVGDDTTAAFILLWFGRFDLIYFILDIPVVNGHAVIGMDGDLILGIVKDDPRMQNISLETHFYSIDTGNLIDPATTKLNLSEFEIGSYFYDKKDLETLQRDTPLVYDERYKKCKTFFTDRDIFPINRGLSSGTHIALKIEDPQVSSIHVLCAYLDNNLRSRMDFGLMRYKNVTYDTDRLFINS